MSEVSKTSEIKFKIGLNDKNIPLDIKWKASDSSSEELRDCKSIMISIWDPVDKNTLYIDLWTNEMMVDEMHTHFFQTLMTMAEGYQRATGNPIAVEKMQAFCKDLSLKTREWEESKNKA